MMFEEAQARAAAGMSLQEYKDMPGTPMWIDPMSGDWSKCHVIMWYRMSQMVPAAAQDAQARKQERDAKRRR